MKYKELPIVPLAVAEVVCSTEYMGLECAEKSLIRNGRIETLRKALTPDGVKNFCAMVDDRCHTAFERKSKWFMECINDRDQLFLLISGWLVEFLTGSAKNLDEVVSARFYCRQDRGPWMSLPTKIPMNTRRGFDKLVKYWNRRDRGRFEWRWDENKKEAI